MAVPAIRPSPRSRTRPERCARALRAPTWATSGRPTGKTRSAYSTTNAANAVLMLSRRRPGGEQVDANVQFMQDDGGQPRLLLDSREPHHPQMRNIRGQLRDDVGIEKKPVHSASPVVKCICLRDRLLAETSRFTPRGMLSINHWPMGFRGGLFAYHSPAGTTTKVVLLPIYCGPSSWARRRISDKRALASATVQTRQGLEC